MKPSKLFPVIIVSILLTGPALASSTYVSVGVGPTWSPDTSNQDEVEFSSDAGYRVSAAVGQTIGLSNTCNISFEGEISYFPKDLHGKNSGNGTQNSADGKTIQAGALLANAWPSCYVDDKISIYAGGGVGPAYLKAFGDSSTTVALQAGSGIMFDLRKNVTLDAGYRYLYTNPVRLDNLRSTYDLHGVMLRGIFRFD